MKMYGIKNCDTVKKAIALFTAREVDFTFVDFKKNPPTLEELKRWKEFRGELPVNKKGSTFRKIKSEFESAGPVEQLEILRQNPSAIKRPILEEGPKTLCIGFDQEFYENY